MNAVELAITILSLAIWVILLGLRGQFWRADQREEVQVTDISVWPSVCAVVPARNEADLLPVTLRSLFMQDYPGSLTVLLIDDHSTDGTAKVAESVAQALDKRWQLNILSGEPLPTGWTGKLWAMEQGISYAQKLTPPPEYFLLTDADIEHDASNLRKLISKAEKENLDLVSLMVLLRCKSFWEQLLIPAFVFFFQKLYPFRWVNDPLNSTAAAAGGCILITREALTRIGGFQEVRQALIDDCALAEAVKSTKGYKQDGKGGIWLGLSRLTHSLRPYPSLSSIWDMVARTAFTQLNYSPWLLLGTLIGMTLIYLVPPVGVILGGLTGNWLIMSLSLAIWLLMAIAYLPTLRLYGCSPLLAFCLPAIALLYTLMTLDSAWRHWQKRGGAWKGRVYPG
ncbi:MAG: glycosyltransferase [Aphanothece sp. CMT-3BRIN-NPC111]|jgi:hopene-associated glycosyltransferase HpnB|nr:glycosyltransferase [Aphanothece sp. CMT-3BRIN-NPC111]